MDASSGGLSSHQPAGRWSNCSARCGGVISWHDGCGDKTASAGGQRSHSKEDSGGTHSWMDVPYARKI